MRRHDGRGPETLRAVRFETGWLSRVPGSVMTSIGNTRVLCVATVDEKVPPFLKDLREGWVTSEYSMIPAATDTRSPREVSRGRPSGRTVEIQRLVGRALRGIVDRRALGERTIWVDCEVLQADGGTRTAGITGGFVALALALADLRAKSLVTQPVLIDTMAAASVGIVEGQAVLDLDYVEDAAAEVDMNVVRTAGGRYVEIQGTAETTPFGRDELDKLLDLANLGIDSLEALQREALGGLLDPLLIGP